MSRRLHVEPWAPEFGSPTGLEGEAGEGKVEVSLEVEGRPWEAVSPPLEATAVPHTVAIIDGVRRVEARVTLDGEDGPRAGVLGVWAVGAVSWSPMARSSRIVDVRIGRRLILQAGGAVGPLTAIAGDFGADLATLEASDPAALVQHLQQLMRQAEGTLAEDLAREHDLVVADGPLRSFSAAALVGFVKTQQTHYLPADAARLLGTLGPGQRTPVFGFAGPVYSRWSWYLRLARVPGGHSWSGIVRLECSGAVSLERVVAMADTTAHLLPRLAPPLHIDSRAPQNLVPIAALERHLKHLLGDSNLAWRRAREVAWAA